MDLSDVIASFTTGTYVVTRASGPGTYTGGRLVAPNTTTLPVDACVQPTEGRDLRKLSEGERVREAKTVFSVDELKTRSAANAADVIAIDGDSYEVVKVQRFAELGNYWKTIVLKLGDL